MTTKQPTPQHLDRMYRHAEVLQYVGLKKTQLAKLIREGNFPKPVPLSERAIAWLESDLIKWQHDRIAARNTEAA